jgi:hypothetical protein
MVLCVTHYSRLRSSVQEMVVPSFTNAINAMSMQIAAPVEVATAHDHTNKANLTVVNVYVCVCVYDD